MLEEETRRLSAARPSVEEPPAECEWQPLGRRGPVQRPARLDSRGRARGQEAVPEERHPSCAQGLRSWHTFARHRRLGVCTSGSISFEIVRI